MTLLVCLALSGCAADNIESVRTQQVATAKEAVDVLASIKDAESAVKAKPKLKDLGNRWRALEKRFDALPPASAEEFARAKSLKAELDGLVLVYVGEAIRVAFVPGGREALNEIGELQKKK